MSARPISLAAGGFGGEEILQVADGFDGRSAAVEDVVGEAEELAVLFGDEGVNGFFGIEETPPGGAGDLGRERCGTGAAVEGVIAVPKAEPLAVVGEGDGADGEGGHDWLV